jgi:hypothetical protein
MMRVLLQQWNGENTFSVELELLQRADGIAGRVVSGRYSTGRQNLVGCDLQEMYQNGVILSNNVKLVFYQSVADSDTLKNGYGVNQLTLIRRMSPRKAVFAGGVDVAAFKAEKGTELVFSEGAGVSGPFYGSGKVLYGAPAGSVEYGAFLTGKTVVAKDRSIQDVVALSALLGGINAGSTGRLAQGYHYTVSADGSYATCQFQRIQGNYICCVRVKFEQSGADVLASTDGARMMTRTVEGVTYDLGIDFYNDWPKVDASGNAIIKDSNGTQYFFYRSIASAHNESGLALSDISFEFLGGQSVLTGVNAMDGASRMTVCGELGLTRSVRVTDLGGLPTNGLVTVGQYGILDLNATAAMHGDGISGGGTEIVVYTNGLLRLSKRSVLSTWKQQIRLYGGNWECGYQMAQTASSDHHHYANTLTLSDGARLYGSPPRVGFRTVTPAWRVTGSVPSVCDSGLHLLSWESRHTVFQLYVEDVTGDEGADLYFNGPLHLFESDAFTNITVRKTGDGTFLQNGVSTLKRENELWRGAWVFGKSGVSEGKQEFHLEGGTTLGLAAGVSNGLGKVLVKAPAKLSFSEDTLLTLDELVLDENARLDIEGTFGKRSLHVAASLSESMLSRISCPEGRVMQDDEGYIRPRIKPLVITVR